MNALLEPANPFWQDHPIFDEAWWAVATGNEDAQPRPGARVREESRARFAAWIEGVRLADPATYHAFVHWRQQQEILAAQKQTLAEQQRIAAQQLVMIAQNESIQRNQVAQIDAINAARIEAAQRDNRRFYP
ncbi:MAG: hypothetical protein ACOYN0_17830 [Phycisphaerales bacterium]